ncbi:MAG: putative toxin-antitoxin system toxin component, PIN family [Elusimicrobia bacterium]|nr:putative toxin-antitoxin system toxin component, PIN family [Elusimicrobiota bacterium]
MSPGSKTLRVVLDTNVLFSAMALPKNSPPTHVFNLVRAGKIRFFVSPFILNELEKNLGQKAGWDNERLQVFRKKLRNFIEIIETTSRVDVIKKAQADNRILECALDAKADVLVTGNMKDIRPSGRYQGIEILTPREFLNKYFPEIA